MPFYTAKTRIGKRCACYDADTDKLIDRVMCVDTDKGMATVMLNEIDEQGKRRARKEVRKGNFYVKDRVTGEVNPPSDTDPESVSRQEALKTNNHGQWNPEESRGLEGNNSFDYIKNDVEDQIAAMATSMTVLPLDVYPHLSDRAKELYDSKLDSTVCEYLEHPDTDDIVFPAPENPINPLVFSPKPPDSDSEDHKKSEEYAEKGYARKCFLVRFVIKQVTVYGNEIPESETRRWAAVLNDLAERDIWAFGTLSIFAMGLACWGDGTQWFNPSLYLTQNTIMGDGDPRKLEEAVPETVVNDEEIQKRGRRFLLSAYIGVNPRFDGEEEAEEVLNKLIGNKLFVEEGSAGNDDWSNLPE